MMIKKIFPYLLVTIVVAVIAKDSVFTPLFPSTHDGENHLARIANYYLAIKQGQFPPRWAPNLEAGLGYTSLNFNYPLANMIALPFLVANMTVEQSLKLIFVLSLLVAGYSMYGFLKERYSTKSALLGSLAYILAPYSMGNIYIRGNVGEVTAFALVPLVLWLAKKLMTDERHHVVGSLACATLLLSHNLIALLSVPFIALLIILEKPDKKSLMRLGKTATIGMMLGAFFWIPALVEKSQIVLEQNPINQAQFVNHFVRFSQLLSSAWDHGYSYTFPVDGMNFSLGILGWLALLITIPLLFLHAKKARFEMVVCSLLVACLFLMTSASRMLWEVVPQASIIQFPWRLLFFAVFLSSMLVAFVVEKTNAKIMGAIIVVTLVQSMRMTLGINYYTRTNDYWFTFPLNTTVNNENDPIWYERTQAHHIKDGHPGNLIILNASGSATLDHWTGSKHIYTLTTQDNATIIEKTLFFPGWETTIDGEKIALKETAYRHAGLINFDVERGEHRVVTQFTQRTPARLIGNGLTLLGIGLLVYQRKKSKL